MIRAKFPKFLAEDVSFFGVKLNDIIYLCGLTIVLNLLFERSEILLLGIAFSLALIMFVRKRYPRNFLIHYFQSKEKFRFLHLNKRSRKK